MTSPTSVTSVAISSLSDFFRIWFTIAVSNPIAAILKIISIFIYQHKTDISNPNKNPNLTLGFPSLEYFSSAADRSTFSFTRLPSTALFSPITLRVPKEFSVEPTNSSSFFVRQPVGSGFFSPPDISPTICSRCRASSFDLVPPDDKTEGTVSSV